MTININLSSKTGGCCSVIANDEHINLPLTLTNLSHRMRFSIDQNVPAHAIKIYKNVEINHDQLLRSYCKDHGICITSIDPVNFVGCTIVLEVYGQNDSPDHFYFWIDKTGYDSASVFLTISDEISLY